MSVASEPVVSSFPLERPQLRGRRRDLAAGILPYFIAGPENQLLSHVCRAGGDSVFQMGNPILLIGATGAGKTTLALHLAARQAITLAVADDASAVKHLPAIDFARQYAEAAGADDFAPFRAEIDDVAILVIDDLQLMREKASAQDELAARLDSRIAQQRPTILTCRRLPSEIRGMRPMLVSRALPGLTVPISVPMGEARRQILRELAIRHSVSASENLLDQLDHGLEAECSVFVLEAAIKQINLWCRMNDSGICAAAVDAAIEATSPHDEIAISRISNTVARFFGLKTSDLRSSSRKQTIVRARSLAMLLARRMTTQSLDHIGAYFGGRDHSTVLHAIRKTESLIQQDNELQQAMLDVSEKLRG